MSASASSSLLESRHQLLGEIMRELYEVNGVDRDNRIRAEKRHCFMEALRGILIIAGNISMPVSNGSPADSIQNYVINTFGGILSIITDPTVLTSILDSWRNNYIYKTGHLIPPPAQSFPQPTVNQAPRMQTETERLLMLHNAGIHVTYHSANYNVKRKGR